MKIKMQVVHKVIFSFFILMMIMIFPACSDSGSSGSGAPLMPSDNSDIMIYMSVSYNDFGEKIELNWTDYPGAEFYHVFRKQKLEPESMYVEITPETGDQRLRESFWTDNSIIHYETYSYRIIGSNSYGDTDFSEAHDGKVDYQKMKTTGYYYYDPDDFNTEVGQMWDLLYGPFDIAFNPGGGFFVAENGVNNPGSGITGVQRDGRISVYDSEGTHVSSWNTTDQTEHFLKNPKSIAVYKHGSGDTDIHVYVADTCNSQIVKYSGTGDYLFRIGSLSGDNPVDGTEDREFYNPGGVAVDRHGNLFVSDSGNNRIQVFGSDGSLIGWWGALSEQTIVAWHLPSSEECSRSYLSGLNNPGHIAVDFNGFVYVADTGNHRVQKFSWNNDSGELVYLGWWGKDNSSKTGWHEPDSSAYGCVTSETDFEEGAFINPYGITLDRFGYVYVSDFELNRIQKFDHEGNYIVSFGENTDSTTQNGNYYMSCRGLAVSDDGDVYVADYMQNSFQRRKKIMTD